MSPQIQFHLVNEYRRRYLRPSHTKITMQRAKTRGGRGLGADQPMISAGLRIRRIQPVCISGGRMPTLIVAGTVCRAQGRVRRVSQDRLSLGAFLLNAAFLRFAAHWGFRPRACRPYRAKTKGKVERPIRYLRESFFYGRTFLDDADLNAQAEHWRATTANRRHRTIGEAPQLCFERNEQFTPKSLAPTPYPRMLPGLPTPGFRRPLHDLVLKTHGKISGDGEETPQALAGRDVVGVVDITAADAGNQQWHCQ